MDIDVSHTSRKDNACSVELKKTTRGYTWTVKVYGETEKPEDREKLYEQVAAMDALLKSKYNEEGADKP